MRNVEEYGLQELSESDCQQVDGGFVALLFSGIALCLSAYAAGYLTGKAIF